MEMMVETFEQTEETISGNEEDRTDEALSLIEKLGLKGQEKMLSKDESGDIQRCPYRKMNVTELKVYETLYPQKNTLEEYSHGMIPLRVLQVAAHAKDLDFFESIQVWGELTAPKDPILVGVEVGEKSWDKTFYILARWGNALEPFDVLYEKAKKNLMDSFKSQAEKSKAKCEKILACLESYAFDALNGEYVSIP